jgi:hypothetical protein
MLPKDTVPTKWPVPNKCVNLPLPLGTMTSNVHTCPLTTKAALVSAPTDSPPITRQARRPKTINIMSGFEISKSDMAMIYMSPDPYFDAFEQPLDLCKFDVENHPTAGLSLFERDGRIHLNTMSPGTPAAKIKDWCTRVKGTWLIKIGDTLISAVALAKDAITAATIAKVSSITLLFAHPKIRPNLSHNGVPIEASAPFTLMHNDQMNNRWEFSSVTEHLRSF